MTNKELLYVQDALNHLKHFNCVCDETASSLTDSALRAFTSDIKSEVNAIYNQLYQTLSK